MDADYELRFDNAPCNNVDTAKVPTCAGTVAFRWPHYLGLPEHEHRCIEEILLKQAGATNANINKPSAN